MGLSDPFTLAFNVVSRFAGGFVDSLASGGFWFVFVCVSSPWRL